MAIVKANAAGITHSEYAQANPPRPGFKCSGETYGGGCFNCGFNTERDPNAIKRKARP